MRKPAIQILDVSLDEDIKEEELVQCLYKQDLEDLGYTEQQVTEQHRQMT